MPGHDCLGLDQPQWFLPFRPESTQDDPEGTIPIPEFGSLDLTFKNQDLLTQGQVFQQQVAAGTEEVAQECENDDQHVRNVVRKLPGFSFNLL